MYSLLSGNSPSVCTEKKCTLVQILFILKMSETLHCSAKVSQKSRLLQRDAYHRVACYAEKLRVISIFGLFSKVLRSDMLHPVRQQPKIEKFFSFWSHALFTNYREIKKICKKRMHRNVLRRLDEKSDILKKKCDHSSIWVPNIGHFVHSRP